MSEFDDVRRVRMSALLMEQWASRDARGVRLSWDWGEPDADGYYTPTVTEHHDDRLGELDSEVRELEAALPAVGWTNEEGRFVVPTGVWSLTLRHVEGGDGYFEPHEEAWYATVEAEPGLAVRGDACPTRAEAVRALRVRLEARRGS